MFTTIKEKYVINLTTVDTFNLIGLQLKYSLNFNMYNVAIYVHKRNTIMGNGRFSIYNNNLLSGHGDSKPQDSTKHEGSSTSDSHAFGNFFVTLFLYVLLKEWTQIYIYVHMFGW